VARRHERQLIVLTPAERRRALAGGVFSLAGILLFVGLAVFALLTFAGASSSSMTALADPYTLRILSFTLLQAFLSTLLSVALAMPVALALARQRRFFGRIWIIRLMAVPMGLPVLIGALGLLAIWGRRGVVNDTLAWLGLQEPIHIYGLAGILLAHVFFNLPLACRLMLIGLERIPAEYWLVSGNLGMPGLSVFRFVEWPALRRLVPGIAGLIFMLCATSFTLVLILGGGPAATTLEVAIYQSLRFDFAPQRAVSLALMQIVVTAGILGFLALFPAPEDRGIAAGKPVRRLDGRKTAARLWDGAVLSLAVLFLGLPLAAVALAGARADLLKLLGEAIFWRAALTSLSIALGAGLLSVSLAMAITQARAAIAAKRNPARTARLFSATLGATSSLVLLVPPVVLATGWFLLLLPGGDTGMLAPVLVLGINTLMSLPFVIRIVAPAVAAHRIRTARLSASLGLAGWTRLRLIDWPGLKKPLLMALSFAMALSLGDLGAVALFGADGLTTLPWLLYSRLGSYRTADADGLALLLGLICLALTIAGTAGLKIPEERDER